MAEASYRGDIVAIGASSGGIEALTAIVAALSRDLPASLFIVLHVPSQSKSQLPEILSRAGPLPAAHATRARRNNQGPSVEKFETRTREAERQAELIRDLLIGGKINAGGDIGSD